MYEYHKRNEEVTTELKIGSITLDNTGHTGFNPADCPDRSHVTSRKADGQFEDPTGDGWRQ